MRHLLLTALASAALCTAAFAADYDTNTGMQDDVAAAKEQQTFDAWHATAAGEPLQVVGLLSREQVQQMRDAHANAGLDLELSIVPGGGVNAGKFYVSGLLAPEMYAAMQAAHAEGGLTLDLRDAPPGVVMGYRDDDNDDTDMVKGQRGDRPDWAEWRDGPGGPHGRAFKDDGRRERRMERRMLRERGGKRWRDHAGRGWRGAGDGWRGARGGWRGGRGANYDLLDRCGHWENDWHQDGCGSVHVHNLADWLPNRAGWSYGFPYGGWDDDFWPHVRNDGSHIWYTGEFWRTHDVVYDVPAWFDAQWAAFGEFYPDTFWLSAWSGYNWAGHGCGCGGCKQVNRCSRCAKWKCGCGHHRCGCR